MGPDLFLVFRHSYETGLLSESQRTAIIRCLAKKGDLTDVRNWRPISLLNADYKIFAKCITNSLATFLPFVISPHQTACHIQGQTAVHAAVAHVIQRKSRQKPHAYV